MTPFPAGLHALAVASLAIAGTCAAVMALDVRRRPQPMAVMNIVWPLTALFGSVAWLAIYYRWGRAPADRGADRAQPPFAVSVLTGASHCGAGCTLGDILAEAVALAVPTAARWFGYGTLFGEKMFAIWIPDFLLAFLIGIVFQYFAIAPVRDLPPGKAVVQALKADVASITAWQVGMYGGMALIQFAWLRPAYGRLASAAEPEFWLAMQVAMLAGFATSYPVNWLLIRAGVKERM